MLNLILPEWLQGFNIIWTAILALVAIGIAALVFLSKKKDETLAIEQKRADANANLLKTRDSENDALIKRNKELEVELEAVTGEYRALAAISIEKLLDYWQIRESELADNIRLRAEARILKKAAGIGEHEDVIHKTNG